MLHVFAVLTLIDSALKIPNQVCLDPEMTSSGLMGGWLACMICLCVCLFHVLVPDLGSMQRDKHQLLTHFA